MAIYCRVSTSDQDNDRQERDLRDYAERAGYEVVAVFRETLSGIRRAKGKRPVARGPWRSPRPGKSTRYVSLIAQTGLTFGLSTPQGKLIANLMASLAEFEHDLLRERVRSGIVAAKARGQTFGRTAGYRPSDKHAPEVIRLSEIEDLSQRKIAEKLGISETTVNEILKRNKPAAEGARSGS